MTHGEGDEASEGEMNLVLLGPPGAGKGTQADLLHKALQLPHVASGDLFRENLRNETELGLLAKLYMDRGDLVPDDVTIAMVRERLQQPDSDQGVILDGFPRTITQAEGLDKMLQSLGRKLDVVLYIAVPDEELIRRLSGRWICSQCQTPYHMLSNPPSEEGICDDCGGTLYQRDDDKPETVRARLKVFHEQTSPLIEYYRDAGLLVEVDGSGDIMAVGEALLQATKDIQA
jgi:adenylate kinase